MSAMDIDAEREKIRQEIEEVKRNLEVEVSSSSLESGSDDDDEDELEDDSDSDIRVEMEMDPGGGNGADEHSEGDADIGLPQTPETCLQMNLVYQEVIQEKIEELNLLLTQNREQQEKLTWELAGTQGTKSSDGKTLPANMFLGHFMKPYFKDKTSGVGPPANPDAREKTLQGIKSFEELITVKWKSREKLLLRQSVVSDHLQHLLQPKLLKLDYLNDKRAKAKDEMDRQILEKQIQETEREISDINLLPEEALLGNRGDKHDWDKIANINFEGTRNATELRKYWQNFEHPSINKKDWNDEEINQLKKIATQHNGVDWEAIAQELGTQRSAFQCLQKFQAYNKDFKKCEWTPEEDQMLLQLVQEMRVGEHIPYRKIAYYMEGRDSAQLIYRWTKRVDPNVRRGAWTPEEDALLLKAVAKYGERDWYKIRVEVPGRSDNQCRDRYLNSLHHDIKKGKWSQEEERNLIELTEKYGVGHWAQIASKLPHRSGTQCLSKWKVLLGYRFGEELHSVLLQNKRNGRRKQESKSGPKERHSSSSEDSDLDLGEAGDEEEEPKTRKARDAGQWQVPGIDMWIPTRKDLSATRPEGLASVTLLSKGFDVNRNRKAGPGAPAHRGEHQRAEGLGSTEPRTLQLALAGMEEESEGSRKNSRSTKDSWRVSLAYVKSVLRRNCYEQQRRSREISRKKRFASNSQNAHGRAGEIYKGQKGGLWKTTLYRRLMMAVTPWAGSMMQAWALRIKTEASRKSKAEFIFKQLQSTSLASTPLFMLFIQLFHIDVNGCMKVIHKRKTQPLEPLKAVGGRTDQASPVQEPAAPIFVCPCPSSQSYSVPARSSQALDATRKVCANTAVTAKQRAQLSFQGSNLPPSKKLIPLKAKEGPGVPACPWKALLPPRPPPKPKTVSELLREKRLREAKAKRMEQKKVILAPQLLLPPSLLIQQSPVPVSQAGSSGSQASPSNAQAVPLFSPAATSVPPLPLAGRNLASLKESTGGSQEKVPRHESEEVDSGSKDGPGSPGSGLPERSQKAPGMANSAPSVLPPQVSETKLPASVASQNSAIVESGTREAPCSAPTFCALGPLGSQQNPVTLVPTLVGSQPGSSAVPKQILPITWVLTPQGLIPLTLVSIPNQGEQLSTPGAPPNRGPAAEASLGKGPAPSVVPTEAASSGPPPGAQAQGASSSTPRHEGASPPTDSSPAPAAAAQLCPAGLAKSQSRPPAACPLAPHNTILGQSPRPDLIKVSSGPLAQPHNACPTLPLLQEEKVTPDYSFISLEDGAAVKEWAKGELKVRHPLVDASLPYLPPFLCSLRTLSALLLNKEALEQSAASLVMPEVQQEDPRRPNLDALRAAVRQRLKDNPAYQLLKARFLAALTFPAALAALPPSRVITTLSGNRWESSNKEDSCLSEEEEDEGSREAARASDRAPGPKGAASIGGRQEEPSTDSSDSDHFSEPGIRRSTRLQKRKRPL